MSQDIAGEVFDASNLSAREQVTNWVKIKDSLGTKCGGYFIGFWEKPAEGVYRRQVSVALRDFNDASIIYGVTLPDYFEKDLIKYEIGDKVGFEYYKDIPATKPGLSATKAVRAFNPTLKEREKNGTAKATYPSAPTDSSSEAVKVQEPVAGDEEGPGF